MAKLWGGRFSAPTPKLMEEFNDSLSFDRRLWKEELEASDAYALALRDAGIYSGRELALVRAAFREIETEFVNERFAYKAEDEDIHTAIERRLVEKIGETGKKIHSGRSRNEQVTTDERIYLKKTTVGVILLLKSLQKTAVRIASDTIDDIVPSYTHLQQAQLIRLGHYFMSLFFMIQDDKERFVDVLKRIDILPLGSGAAAGSTLKLDRRILKRELGFVALSPNSVYGVSDRAFITEFLYAAAQTLVHLSRFAEDLIIWSSSEFRFIELNDMYSTGSSMMPQKKNPDSLELIRGKASRAIANLNSILILQKGLPLTYSKDLQEDKEPLFDSVATLLISVKIFEGVISTLKVNRSNLLQRVDDSIYATDIADYLTERGIPFRDAHKIVGKLVLLSLDKNEALRDVELSKLRKLSAKFGDDYYDIFNPVKSVERHDLYGGTSLKRVKEQISLAHKMMKEVRASRR